jgi:cell division protein FtsL
MTSPLRARAAETRAGTAPERRPDLRVVDPAPRRRAGRVGTVAGVGLFAALFGLAAFQTVLIKNQARIDDLDRRIDVAATEAETLALQVAELESPDRITAVARDRLGMIDPGSVTYLRPMADDDARALLPSPPAPAPVPDPAAAGGVDP